MGPVTIACLLGMVGGQVAFAPTIAVICAIALAGLCTHRRAWFILLAVWAALGACRGAVWQLHPAAALVRTLPADPSPVAVHALVVDDPSEPLTPSLRDPDEPWAIRCAAVLELRHVRTGPAWTPAIGRVRMVRDGSCPSYGDEILAEGGWRRVPAQGNWGVYDWRAALARDHVHGLLRVRPSDGWVRLRARQGSPLVQAAADARHRMDRLAAAVDPRRAGLIRSFVLGRRAELEERLRAAFVETGTMHLVVVSGSHVGLIALILELLLRLLGVPWRGRLALVAAAVGGYWLLIGAQAPVGRAALMAWVVLGAAALGRVIDWSGALAAAALAIGWAWPAQLFDAGFQLSVGAVAALIAFTPGWTSALATRLSWAPKPLRWWLAASLAATAAVWIGLWPVLAWYFHVVSPVTVLANLLLSPLVSVLVGSGTLLLALGMLWPVAWTAAWPLLAVLVDAIAGTAMWCRALPPGPWYVGQPPLALIAAYYVVLAGSWLAWRRGVAARRLAIAWLAAVNMAVWTFVVSGATADRWLTVQVLDVGHGDAMLVRAPGRRTLLIDAGTREAGRLRVVPALRQAGIARLDALVLTHWDDDHAGGAAPVLEAVRVDRILTNGAADARMAARRVRALAQRRRLPVEALAAGAQIDGGTWRIEVLHPPPGFVPEQPPGGNDNSLVMRLSYGDISVLLTGDIDEPGLPGLLEAGNRLRSTLLKVPHHGSRLGLSGARLLELVRPSWALLSVGQSHHLPAAETLEVLAQAGAQVRSTRRDGAIQIRTDGHRLLVRTRLGQG